MDKPPTSSPIPPAYHDLIASALVYAGGTHTVEDVEAMVASGRAQFWPGPQSCVVTEIDEQPRCRILHFFLAAGNTPELAAMEEGLLAWGVSQGCTKARIVGRKGWERSFLHGTGWVNTHVVVMEKPLHG